METLRLKNYRKFEDTGDINLKPLTLLIGANSSGKSSFLKFFPLIKQTVRRHPNGVFLWYSDDVDFKDFNNTVKEGTEQIEIEFSVEELRKEDKVQVKVGMTVAMQTDKKDYLKQFNLDVTDISIKILFPAQKNGVLNIIINDREYRYEKCTTASIQAIVPDILFFNGKDDPDLDKPREVEEYLENALSLSSSDLLLRIRNTFFSREEIRRMLKNYDLLPEKEYEAQEWRKIEDAILIYNINRYLESISYYLDNLATNITYIQPLRAMAERYYRIQNVAIDEIDSHGDNLAMYIYSLDKNDRDEFSGWLSDLFGFNIKIEPSSGHVEMQIKEFGDKGYKNLVDVGFGYSQLLPILASIWNSLNRKSLRRRLLSRSLLRRQTERFIVIEQPELHLHPRFIAMFAKMLLQIISSQKNKRPKFIIETHSETLINYIGKYLAENIEEETGITEKDISIVLFNGRNEGFGSDIVQTGYDSEGYLIKWPYGFFSGEKAINGKESVSLEED